MTQPAEDFSDFPVAANDATAAPVGAAPAAVPTLSVTPTDTTAYLNHFKGLIATGASKQQIEDYARSQGVDPAQIQGLDEVLKLRDSGSKDYAVALQGVAPPAQAQVAKAPTDDFSDFPTAAPTDPSLLDQIERGVGLTGRAALRGFGQLTDLVSAPLKAVQDIGNMIAPSLIDPAASDKYSQAADNVGNSVGLPVPQNTAERVNDAALSGATTGLATAGVSSLAAPASKIASMVAGAPALELAGGAGSGAGGQIAKENGAGPWGQLAASLVGGALAPATATGIAKSTGRVFQSTNPSDLLAAFQRQQVQPMAAQVGGMGSRMMTSGAKATLGGLPLAAAAEKSIATAKAARDRIAALMGNVMDDTGAGQAVQKGVRSFIESTGTRASKLYDAIPIGNAKPAVLANTKQALAELNAGLPSNPELSGMLSDGRLQGYEAALTGKPTQVPTGLLDAEGQPIMRTVTKGGGLSWQDLKAFRSYIGELAGRPTMQESTSKGALQRLYAGLSEDMKATASQEGPDALKAFQKANNFYRARQDRIDNTLKLVLGNDFQKSPEGAFAQIDRWARDGGDAARLARTIRSLPADEAATVRATIFSRLGRASPGQQGAAVDTFSPSSFGTQWAKLDHRAKSILFPGVEYRQSIDDIARISQAMKESEKFANTSGTALAERLGKNLFGATVVSYILHPTAAIAGEGIGYAGGMLLASPRFARWVASSVNKPNGPATLAHINRLSSIAVAEPAIANEVLALQQRLATAFLPQTLAAKPEDQK